MVINPWKNPLDSINQNPGGMGFWTKQPDGSWIGGDSFNGQTRPIGWDPQNPNVWSGRTSGRRNIQPKQSNPWQTPTPSGDNINQTPVASTAQGQVGDSYINSILGLLNPNLKKKSELEQYLNYA